MVFISLFVGWFVAGDASAIAQRQHHTQTPRGFHEVKPVFLEFSKSSHPVGKYSISI
jgi:hypothetical protein